MKERNLNGIEEVLQCGLPMRREEIALTRSLLNTARLIQDNDPLFKLKEMEFMEKIADKLGEITINSGGVIVDQLRSMISVKKEYPHPDTGRGYLISVMII